MTAFRDMSDVELETAIRDAAVTFTTATLEKERRGNTAEPPQQGVVVALFKKQPHLLALLISLAVLLATAQVLRFFK